MGLGTSEWGTGHLGSGIGVNPRIISIISLQGDIIRVNFSEPMTDSTALNSLGSYIITPDVGSVALTVIAVTPENVLFPSYVFLTFDTIMTIGAANYSLTASTSIIDSTGDVLVPPYNVMDFNGFGEIPFIYSSSYNIRNPTKLRVVFSKPVKQVSPLNADDALNPANYAISAGATVSSVAHVSSDEVLLTISSLHYPEYTITASNIQDLVGNSV